jgi:hypothetical protein
MMVAKHGVRCEMAGSVSAPDQQLGKKKRGKKKKAGDQSDIRTPV